jgi:hypothetical protein
VNEVRDKIEVLVNPLFLLPFVAFFDAPELTRPFDFPKAAFKSPGIASPHL